MVSPAQRLTYCRICAASCGLVVTVARDRVIKVRGDADHPISRGYTCVKGRSLGEWHHRSDRLNQPRVNGRDASWQEALSDLGQRLAELAGGAHDGTSIGADSIAMYLATGCAYDSGAQVAAGSFMRALGSTSFASAATVDNAPVLVAAQLITGHAMLNPVWDPAAGGVVVFVGTNPVVSHGYGTALPDPVRYLKEHQQRGGAVIVIDPRRTETALLADLYLQTRPGGDVFLLAWLAAEALHAADRPGRVGIDPTDLAKLSAALVPFTLEAAMIATDLGRTELTDLRDRVVRSEGKLAIFCGTGVTMARDGVLAEWMRWVLLALTGSLDVKGGMQFHRGFVNPLRRPRSTTAHAPEPVRSRPELTHVVGQLPAVALVDEIEAGNIKALIVAGGNPTAALPQPNRMRDALASLEVLVTIDVMQSAITELATHVLPAVGQLERADVTLIEAVTLRNGLQSTQPVVEPIGLRRPVWWIFSQLGREMGLDLLGGSDPDDLTDVTYLGGLLARAPIDAQTVFAAGPRGVDLPSETGWVLDELVPGGRWHLAPDQLLERLTLHRSIVADLVLIPHRQLGRSNSVGFRQPDDAPADTAVHPTDALRLGLGDGDPVLIRSAHGEVMSTVRVTKSVRPGAVSCSHGRGPAGTGILVGLDDIDPLTAMPVASGVAVTITRRLP